MVKTRIIKQIQTYRYIQMFSKKTHAYRVHAHTVPVKDLLFYLYHLYLYMFGQWTVMDSSFLKSLTGTARTCGTRDKFLNFTVHYCPLSKKTKYRGEGTPSASRRSSDFHKKWTHWALELARLLPKGRKNRPQWVHASFPLNYLAISLNEWELISSQFVMTSRLG